MSSVNQLLRATQRKFTQQIKPTLIIKPSRPKSAIKLIVASHDPSNFCLSDHVAILHGAESAKKYLIKHQILSSYLPIIIDKNIGPYGARRLEETIKEESSLLKLLLESRQLKTKAAGIFLKLLSTSYTYNPLFTTTFLSLIEPLSIKVAAEIFSVYLKNLPRVIHELRQENISPWFNFLLSETPSTRQDAQSQLTNFFQLLYTHSRHLNKGDTVAIKLSNFFTMSDFKQNIIDDDIILSLGHQLYDLHRQFGINFVIDSEPMYDPIILNQALLIASIIKSEEPFIGVTIASRYPRQSIQLLENIFNTLIQSETKIIIKLVKGAPYGIKDGQLMKNESRLDMLSLITDKKVFDSLNTISSSQAETQYQYQLIANCIKKINYYFKED